MKKALYITLVLIALLISLVGTAAAAPSKSKNATLVDVGYSSYKGPVFTFDVTGKFKKAELNGKLQVQGGGQYGLYCTQVDEDTVTCNTSKEVAGVNVTLLWGGFIFWTYVPNAPGPSTFCYSVWDWWDFTGNQWTDFGPYCQGDPASAYDAISYTVPDPNGSFESWAEFHDENVSGECPSPVPYQGPAYYFPQCPATWTK